MATRVQSFHSFSGRHELNLRSLVNGHYNHNHNYQHSHLQYQHIKLSSALKSICLLRGYHASRASLGNAVNHTISNANSPVEHPIMPPINFDRNLLIDVLKTAPTQREARTFVKRFAKREQNLNEQKQQQSESKEKHEKIPLENSKSLKRDTEKLKFIDSLLSPSIDHIALIKIQGPLNELYRKYIAKTLLHLQKLGLMSIVVVGNEDWKEMILEGSSRFRELSQKMIAEVGSICDAIEQNGGRATPIYNSVFTIDKNPQDFSDLDTKKKLRTTRFPGLGDIDVSLSWLKSSLKFGQIPLILPIVVDKLSNQLAVRSNIAMIALSHALSNLSDTGFLKTPELEPMKIILINTEGGIPSQERRGSHVFINLKEEYEQIKQDYQVNPQWNITHSTGLENLDMMKTCLDKLPSTSSGIIVPAYAPTVLLSNLITDKPLFSSSLPLSSPTTPWTTTTILRTGMQVIHHSSFDTIDIPAFKALVETSFGKKLDLENYLKRVEKCVDTIIVTGDYAGVAVITMESASMEKNNNDNAERDVIPYLDKLAVDPEHQGTGVADLLWKQIQIKYPKIMWRARVNNPVNKWYFERADGNLRVPGSQWMMFWYGNEELKRIKQHAKIVQQIPSSIVH
ncbi:3606_t:CDS:2 [Ambispora leptoticha]|uniref:Amino-acid acetyltransferase, mitochondrial n=1 Tax=Ambispora leptoticha TaxID=144679 RepID=A0A9N8VBC5_9GLOM|nr:3606_t:CDS:2 [Ambispora leptoticha]